MGRKVPRAGRARTTDDAARQALVPAEVEHVLPDPGSRQRRWTPEETREQMAFVEQVMLERPDLTPRRRAILCHQKFGIGAKRVEGLVSRVRQAWESEDTELRAKKKSEQGRRILRHLSAAKGEKDERGAWKTKPNWPAVAKFEELYASLYGTRDPIKVSVDVRMSEALIVAIAQMTPEELMEEVEAYNREVELAEAYRREHPEVTVLDSAAE